MKIVVTQCVLWAAGCALMSPSSDRLEFIGGGQEAKVVLVFEDSRFSYRTEGARPLAYQGRWSEREGKRVLSPEYNEATDPYPSLPVEWRMVDWGARRYLVPEGRIIAFCNAVNLGDEPRAQWAGEALLRKDDWAAPITALPLLPDEWKPFLLARPITGRVTDIEEGGFARLSVGGAQGLNSGMALVAHRRGEARCCRLKVVCPCENGARVEILCGEECELAGLPAGDLVMDDEVSTSRSALNWRKRVGDGVEVVFVPEMGELPADLSAEADAPIQKRDEDFSRAWRAAAPAVHAALTPAALARLSRWSPDAPAARPAALETLQALPFRLQGAVKPGESLLYVHDVAAGAELPARRGVHRRLCVAVEFDATRRAIMRVYVTIRGWVEE